MKWLFMLGISSVALLAQTLSIGTVNVGTLTQQAAAGGGGGDPTFVLFTNNPSAETAQYVYLTNTVASGDALVVGLAWEGNSATPSVADSTSDTFGMVTNAALGTTMHMALFVAKNCAGGAAVKTTADLTASRSGVSMVLWRISGASTTDPIDQRAIGTDAGSAIGGITGTVTTTQANELLCYGGRNYSSAASTPKSGWTEDFDSDGCEWQHYKATSTGNFFGTNYWVNADAMVACLITIK